MIDRLNFLVVGSETREENVTRLRDGLERHSVDDGFQLHQDGARHCFEPAKEARDFRIPDGAYARVHNRCHRQCVCSSHSLSS